MILIPIAVLKKSRPLMCFCFFLGPLGALMALLMPGNGFNGYELEEGDYTLFVSRNAHEAVQEIALTLAEGIQIGEDPVTANEVVNRYTDMDEYLDSDWQLDTQLSRADWEGTWPTAQTAETHAGTEELYEQIKDAALAQKQDDYYDQATDALLDAANVKYYPERLQ